MDGPLMSRWTFCLSPAPDGTSGLRKFPSRPSGGQLGLLGLGVGRACLVAVLEDLVGPGEQLLLPAVDQGRVDPVLAGQLVDGLVPLERRQGHLSLESRRVLLPLALHRLPLSWATRV